MTVVKSGLCASSYDRVFACLARGRLGVWYSIDNKFESPSRSTALWLHNYPRASPRVQCLGAPASETMTAILCVGDENVCRGCGVRVACAHLTQHSAALKAVRDEERG